MQDKDSGVKKVACEFHDKLMDLMVTTVYAQPKEKQDDEIQLVRSCLISALARCFIMESQNLKTAKEEEELHQLYQTSFILNLHNALQQGEESAKQRREATVQ